MQQQKRTFTKTSGFTIVELLIVIVVIGILAAVTIVAFNGVKQKALDASLKSDLSIAYQLLSNELTTTGLYPATAAAANGGKGLPASNGTTYTYSVNNSGTPSYLLTGTNPSAKNTYSVSNVNGTPTVVTGSAPVITTPASNSVTSSDGCGSGYYYFGLYSTATGTPTPTVQWQRLSTKNTTTGTWIDISGATTGYYSWDTRGTLLEPDYMVFRAVWTSGGFTSTSPTIQISLTNGC